MNESLNESMERRKADLETVHNRTMTLKEHFNNVYDKLNDIYRDHPDYFDNGFALVDFDSAMGKPSSFDALVARTEQLDRASRQYVKMMCQYGKLKDSHPDIFR